MKIVEDVDETWADLSMTLTFPMTYKMLTYLFNGLDLPDDI